MGSRVSQSVSQIVHINNSGARTSDWRDRPRGVWLQIIRRAGLRASPETPHLLHDSQKRPDVKVHIGNQVTLLAVRTCSTTTAGTNSTQRFASTPGYSAEMGANSKHNDWDIRYYQKGGRQAEVTEA